MSAPHFKRFALAALSAICLMPAASFAKPHPKKHYVKKNNARVNSPWENRADKNGNGIVGPKEKWNAVHKQADVTEPWEFRADKNRDGTVGPKEARSFQNNHNNSTVNAQWEKHADLDNSGVIDERERLAWEQNHPNPNNPYAKVNQN